MLVLYAVSYARNYLTEPSADLTAKDICRGLRDYAKVHFGGEAHGIGGIAGVGIRRSEDVGAIMFALVEAGRLKLSQGDRVEQFSGLFTLQDLFAADL